jgi:GYF domain 2
MREYYYLKGRDQIGPFSLEELRQQPLSPGTLIWYEGLTDWLPATQFSELRLGPSSQPPPVPSHPGENDLTDSIKNKTKKNESGRYESWPNKVKKYRWILVWIGFHLLALLLSLKEIKIFNATGEPKPEKFWPFVKFTNPFFDTTYNRTFVLFNGIFSHYDWTEFSFYVGGAIFLVTIAIVYKKSS